MTGDAGLKKRGEEATGEGNKGAMVFSHRAEEEGKRNE